MRTMKAVQIDGFGGPEVLQFRELSVPEPGAREILLKIHAAGINPVDHKIRSGKYPQVREDKLPYILGRDVSGVVEAVGVEVTEFLEGEELYALPGIDRGGYAEYVILKEHEAARKPSSLDHIAAAAVPLAALTAWQGLFRYGQLEAGQRVLIHSGSGGVGHFAIQFARAKGALVATTVSAENMGARIRATRTRPRCGHILHDL
jgi:NADPH:quinone reductase-like Zn-dependent oxidoreductase